MTPTETMASEGRPEKWFFSPDMTIWRVDREMILLLAGGRALLMQLAHPKVAAGVAHHSRFQADPFARVPRTMGPRWSIVFDDRPLACAALGRVKKLHGRVRGAVPQGEYFYTDEIYDALDVELLLWVHATLIDSAMMAYDLFVKPLTPAERSLYYDDSKKLASLFEIPEARTPPTLSDFDSYMGASLATGEIQAGPTAMKLAGEILYPRPWFLRPAGPLLRLITAGLLPAPLRETYGIGWNKKKERRLRLFAKGVRYLLPFMPQSLRVVPNARRAERTLPARLGRHAPTTFFRRQSPGEMLDRWR
jgi:uncharacterized protein (DUF2236 family)